MRHEVITTAEHFPVHLPPLGGQLPTPETSPEYTATAAPLQVEVAHRLAARTRLRCTQLRGDAAGLASLATRLAAVPGVTATETNPLTGSLLIHHAPHLAPVVIEAALAPVAALTGRADALTKPSGAGLDHGQRLALSAACALVRRARPDTAELALELLLSVLSARPSPRLLAAVGLYLLDRTLQAAEGQHHPAAA